MRRHIRKYHPQSELPASRALKACTACRQRKEICEGGSPCKACERRRLDCSLVDQSSPIRRPHGLNDLNLPNLESPSTDDYVEIYFQHFHPEWPFLFRSTFDPETEPGVLVQSVVMLGMWAYGSSESKDMAVNLHRRLESAIQSQRVSLFCLLIDLLVLTIYPRANGTIRLLIQTRQLTSHGLLRHIRVCFSM